MGTEKRERQKANRALKQQQMQHRAARRKTLRYALIGVGAVVGVFLIAWIASNFVGDDDPVTPSDTVVSVTEPDDVTNTVADGDSIVTVPSAPTTAGG